LGKDTGRQPGRPDGKGKHLSFEAGAAGSAGPGDQRTAAAIYGGRIVCKGRSGSSLRHGKGFGYRSRLKESFGSRRNALHSL